MKAEDWIPLAERKPEKPGHYLVYSPHQGISEWTCCDDGMEFTPLITHWMPIPPPPEPPDPFETWWNRHGIIEGMYREIAPGHFISEEAARIVWDAIVNATKKT